MAEFCTFSWWWLVPLVFMMLFVMACIAMMTGGFCMGTHSGSHGGREPPSRNHS